MSTSSIVAGAAYVKLLLDDKQAAQGLEKTIQRVKSFSAALIAAGDKINFAMSGAFDSLNRALSVFSGFDDRMRMVVAVTGASGAAFDMLTEKAKKLGRETAFTASQVGDAMISLGRMGFSPVEIDQAISSVMALSSATGTDLATASEIAAANLRVFGLDASQMTRVADLLTATANGSAQSLIDLGESMKMAGPHISNAGESIEDACAALGILANMGIRGSLAGTALGNSYKKLADPAVRDFLKQYNLQTTDAAGNLRKMRDILVDMAKVLRNMPTAERITFTRKVFDERGSLGGGVLVRNVEGIDTFLEKLDHSAGTALRTMEQMESGIGGMTRALLSANYLPHEEADLLADRLAKTGFNAVRFHHHDSGMLRRGANDGLSFDPAELDKLDYLFAALKKRGIYLTTDIYCSRRIKAGDGIPEAVLENPAFQMKALLPISDAALRNWKEFARRWLTHRNPYTGMSWAEDPALYVVSFTNENNLDFCWNTVPEIGELYRKAFPGWMAEHHPGEPAGRADPAVNRRFREFLYERQHRCILEQMNFLKKELNLAALCTDLNMQSRVPLALIRNDLDVVDNHKYHDHPSFPVNLWRLPNQFYQRSAISRLGNEVPLLLFAARLFGKPYGITEFKFCPPNRFRSEGGPLIGGYAALQGWNSLYQFAWSHSREGNLRFPGGSTFNYAAEPLAQFSDRLAMFLFRRGDVAPARAAFGWRVPENFWNSDAPEAYPAEFSTLGLISRIGTVVGENAPQGVRLLTPEQAAGKSPLADRRIEALRRELLDHRIAVSDTGELRLDAGRNTLAVVSPRSESVTVAAGALRAERLRVAGARVPQTVSVSTLDERPVGESGRMLLFHLTNVLPNKTRFSDERMTLLESWGEPRLLLRRDPVRVSLTLEPGAVPAVEALRFDGSSAGRVASKFENGVLTFTADPGAFPGGVMAYLLTRR